MIYIAKIYNSTDPFYTRKFNTQHAPKDVYKPSLKQHTNSCPALEKGTHTTKLEEGKIRVMSNAINQRVNKPHTSNIIEIKLMSIINVIVILIHVLLALT